MIKELLFTALSVATAITAHASDLDFTYNSYGNVPEGLGFGKVETYDVAVLLSGADLIGKRVKGFTVPINASSDKLENLSGWLSTTLEAEKQDKISVNVPNVANVDATVDSNGVMTVMFPESHEIPQEGIYVGYTFRPTSETDDNGGAPVSVVPGRLSGSLWMHSSTTQQKWADYSKRKECRSAMTVFLEGDFATDAAVAVLPAEGFLSMEGETPVETEVINHGTEPIVSIDYVYTLGGTEQSGSFSFDEPVPAVFGRAVKMPLTLPAADEKGETPLEFRITRVNGKDNGSLETEPASSLLTARLFVPVTRPLVEEFTGLNCGWCPRGYVMLEQEKQKHGDRFVALSYHSSGWESGAMCCIDPGEFPIIPSGYPNAALNRSAQMDPSNIPARWAVAAAQTASCSIETDIAWSDDTMTELKVTGKARFINSLKEHGYRLSLALVADRLCDPSWEQANYYNRYDAEGIYTGPFWDLFIGKPDHVTGLIFNDIVVYYKDVQGIEGSLPEEIEAGETYEYSFTVPVESIVNLRGKSIVNDFNKVRAVGMILNNGRPANCISSVYPDGTNGVETLPAEDRTAAVVAVTYHDLQGRRLESPAIKGMTIVTETLDNGEKRTYKLIK